MLQTCICIVYQLRRNPLRIIMSTINIQEPLEATEENYEERFETDSNILQ